eukprot:maker-scaffold195_size270011-snap-gene-0.18 protein:Tk11324 transcript:maker-scaffold195_size270011-snap-gene-0.18-mRNA-1 annotation:"predicted protein"
MSFPAPERVMLDLLNESQRNLEAADLRAEVQRLARRLQELRQVEAALKGHWARGELRTPRHYYPQAFRTPETQAILRALDAALGGSRLGQPHAGGSTAAKRARLDETRADSERCLALTDAAARMRLYALMAGVAVIQGPELDVTVLQFTPQASGCAQGPFQLILKRHPENPTHLAVLRSDLPLSSRTLNLEAWLRADADQADTDSSNTLTRLARRTADLLAAWALRQDQVNRMRAEISEDVVDVRLTQDATRLSFYLKIEVSDEAGDERSDPTAEVQKMTVKIRLSYDASGFRPIRGSVVIGGGRTSIAMGDEDIAILEQQCQVFYEKDLALDSPYVVRLFDIFPQGLGFVLVFEHMITDLAELIQNVEHPLTEPQTKTYMVMLLKGTQYMHEMNIMHRDLKPANLLISSDGSLKIADMGLSRVFTRTEKRPYSHQVATRWYRAPELLYGARNYSESVDLWSIGCIFGELLNFSPVFPGENDIDQLGLVIRTLGTPNETIWPGVSELPDYSKITFPTTTAIQLENLVPDASPEAQSLFKRFIKYDAQKRISAKAALLDMYFFVPPDLARQNEMPTIQSKEELKKRSKESKSPQFGTEAWETRLETGKFEDLLEDLLAFKPHTPCPHAPKLAVVGRYLRAALEILRESLIPNGELVGQSNRAGGILTDHDHLVGIDHRGWTSLNVPLVLLHVANGPDAAIEVNVAHNVRLGDPTRLVATPQTFGAIGLGFVSLTRLTRILDLRLDLGFPSSSSTGAHKRFLYHKCYQTKTPTSATSTI